MQMVTVTEFNARCSALGFSNFEVGEGGGPEVGGGGFIRFPEMEFLDISLIKKLESLAPCYSQSLLLAAFNGNLLYSGCNNPYKIQRNKKTLVYS
jgi:hypothetical protein